MINRLNKLYEEGLLQKQIHPKHDLIIWNYTPKVSYEKLWNVDDLLLKCRGLITDFNGNIIANCIPKFFNFEELSIDNIPNEPFEFSDKMDGSYINFFHYNNEWIFSSRGSFTSDQAILANKIFNEKYLNKVSLNINYNYIMEVIGIDNIIVILYPENDLILLTCISNENKEIDIYTEEFNGFNRVKKYNGINDYKKIKELISDNAEGYVICFKNGFRMKIKGDEYCRLHSIITNVSNIVIWEHLKDKLPLEELLNKVPDEFNLWVKNIISTLHNAYNEIERSAMKEFFEIYYQVDINNRKEFAEKAVKARYTGIIFSLLDKKNYENYIWKAIRPKYSKPFRDGYDLD